MISTVVVFQDYTTDGVNKNFTIPFQFTPGDANNTVKVYEFTTAGAKTLKTLSTDYTLSPAGDSPTTVIYNSAPTGVTVRVQRELPFTQLMDYINTGLFNADDHEKGLDKIIMLLQQLKEATDNALKLAPANYGIVSGEMPVAVPGAVVTVSADGKSFVFSSPTAFVSGNRMYSGTGAPSALLGIDGDTYLDLNTPYTLYKKVAGAWVSQGTLLGATGAAGATGPQGAEFLLSEVAINVNPVVTQTRYLATVGGLTFTSAVTPANNDTFSVKDQGGNFSTTPCTFSRNGNNVENLAADYIMDADYGTYEFQFRTGKGWVLVV